MGPRAAHCLSVRAALDRSIVRPCYIGRFLALAPFDDGELNCLSYAYAPPFDLLRFVSCDVCMADKDIPDAVVAVNEAVSLFLHCTV